MPGDVAVFPKIAIDLSMAYKELVRINRHKTLPYGTVFSPLVSSETSPCQPGHFSAGLWLSPTASSNSRTISPNTTRAWCRLIQIVRPTETTPTNGIR